MKLSTALILFATETIFQCGARQLTWSLSTNYNSTKNWSKERLPCSTDTVVFPTDMRLTVELPESQLRMKEIALPRNGEIVFPFHGSIFISSQNTIDGSCDGGINTWVRDTPGKWMSPDSWYGPSPACPDLERVPCAWDDVVFPSGSTFMVELPPFPVMVLSVIIKGTRLIGADWDNYLLTPEGDRQFANGPLLSLGFECHESSGCECFPQMLTRWICTTKTCQMPRCLNPVQPLGDCCLKCGAYLLYKFKDSTKISDVEALVNKTLAPEQVYWHVGKTMGYIQVVLTERDYSGVTEELATKLDHILSNSGLGLKQNKLEASGVMVPPGVPGESLLIFFLSLLIAVALFTFLFVYYDRGMPSIIDLFSGTEEGTFAFARFENQSGAVELGASAGLTVEPNENVTREFANPMYSEVPEVIVKKKVFSNIIDNGEDYHPSSEDTSLSDAETEVVIGVPDHKNMEEVQTSQLLD